MHSHSHGSEPCHHHAPASFGRAFAFGILLNGGFVVAEFVFGLLSRSLSLMADAGHNLSDVLGLLLAWGATILAQKQPTDRYTYGLRRSTILAALGNAVLLFVSVGGVAWEALHRLLRPDEAHADARIVIAVAAIGIVINTATALMFLRGRDTDINLRGAYLHMLSDALVSAGVVVAGAIILTTGWLWVDSVVSLAIVAVILLGTWGLFRDSMLLSLDAVPNHIDLRQVRDVLAGAPGVREVCDLHIWAMSTTEAALTARLRVETGEMGGQMVDMGVQMRDTDLLTLLEQQLHDQFGIEHTTIQLETFDRDRQNGCALLPNLPSQ